jgi:hypothetical protein
VGVYIELFIEEDDDEELEVVVETEPLTEDFVYLLELFL